MAEGCTHIIYFYLLIATDTEYKTNCRVVRIYYVHCQHKTHTLPCIITLKLNFTEITRVVFTPFHFSKNNKERIY